MPENQNLAAEIAFDQLQELRVENICYQLATRGKWPFNNNFNSTSFFIDRNFLLTSAHNVVRTYRSVNRLNIVPSRVGDQFQFHLGQFTIATDDRKNFRIFPTYQIYCVGYLASAVHTGRYGMTLDKSEMIKINKHSFTYNLLTATGNSGSPIMVKRKNQFHVIGVNSIKYNGTLTMK